MPKLCQCKRDILQYYFYLIDPETVAIRQKYLLKCIEILESDCVCGEPTRITCSCRYHNGTCPGIPLFDGSGRCKDCQPNCFKENRSQSPCDHPKDKVEEFEVKARKPNFVNNSGVDNDLHWFYSHKAVIRMWACKACGLVKCKNPNQE